MESLARRGLNKPGNEVLLFVFKVSHTFHFDIFLFLSYCLHNLARMTALLYNRLQKALESIAVLFRVDSPKSCVFRINPKIFSVMDVILSLLN